MGKRVFRAWVVISIVWIGLAFFIAGPVTYSWLWKAPKYEIGFERPKWHNSMSKMLADAEPVQAAPPVQANTMGQSLGR
jgi:hypothetical protein